MSTNFIEIESVCTDDWLRYEATTLFVCFLQDIVKELSRVASLNGNPSPVSERRSSGGIAFTAGEVRGVQNELPTQ